MSSSGSSRDPQPGNSEVIVLRAGHVLTMGAAGDITDGAVAFSEADGLIRAVGDYRDVSAGFPGARTVGDSRDIVTPGFVNAHDHLSEGLISGMGETMTLYEWAARLINPVLRHLTRELARAGTMIKAAEMIRSGITTVNDMFVHLNPGSYASLGVADGLEEVGLGGVICFGPEDMADSLPASPLLDEHEALHDRVSRSANLGFRLGIGTIHGQSDDLFRESIGLAARNGWKVHTHLAEVREEITEARLRYGTNTLGRGVREGLLDLDVIFAHCIWVNEPDVEILARHQATVAHNPLSNMILASGVCPVPRLRAAGIPVALGTDGAGSNDSHDMLQVMKAAALLQKLHHLDPLALTARDAMAMATIEGARALRADQRIGSLEVGKQADLVRFAGDGVRLAYVHDPYQQLAFCAGPDDISDVWVAGRPVLADRKLTTCDEAEVIAEARRCSADLATMAGLQGLSAMARPASRAAGMSKIRNQARNTMPAEELSVTWPVNGRPVRLIDCSQPWNADTPPFPADEPPTVVWAKRLSSHGTNHQRISTQLHIGTHIDAPLHWREEGMDIASIPLERLYGPVVIADLSDVVSDFYIITPADIEAKVEVKPGDILIIYTGYSRYYSGGSEPDLIRYFFKRPGADGELADWLVRKQIRWLGVDSSSPDHPMNSNTRDWWPLVYEEAEAVMGVSPKERFPLQHQTICHVRLFQHDIPIVENLNSNVTKLTGPNAHICAFPWKFAGGEAALVRVVGFAEAD